MHGGHATGSIIDGLALLGLFTRSQTGWACIAPLNSSFRSDSASSGAVGSRVVA